MQYSEIFFNYVKVFAKAWGEANNLFLSNFNTNSVAYFPVLSAAP